MHDRAAQRRARSDIADRLRTRFARGLLADIEPPELGGRIAILRKKAAVESVALPDAVAIYIASAIMSNVRELEGALIRLAAYASLSKRRIARRGGAPDPVRASHDRVPRTTGRFGSSARGPQRPNAAPPTSAHR